MKEDSKVRKTISSPTGCNAVHNVSSLSTSKYPILPVDAKEFVVNTVLDSGQSTVPKTESTSISSSEKVLETPTTTDKSEISTIKNDSGKSVSKNISNKTERSKTSPVSPTSSSNDEDESDSTYKGSLIETASKSPISLSVP